MKVFTYLLFFVAGILAVAGAYAAILDEHKAEPRSDELVTREGKAEHAVVVPLSQIPQETSTQTLGEILNEGEEADEIWRQPGPVNLIPQILPQHQDQRDRGAVAASRTSDPLAPTVRKMFGGIPNTGPGQPDSILAVGPNHVLLAVNTSFGVYTKTGQRRFLTSFDSWFSPLARIAGGAVLFDPRVLYDQYSQHYIFLCTARRADHRSWNLLSVSKTGNPEGDWAYYALDMQDNAGERDLWGDFPRLGVDQSAVYITDNMYTFHTYRFHYSKIRVFQKKDLYAFGSLPFTEFSGLVDATGVRAHSIEPAHSYGNTTAEFFVNTNAAAGNKITVWKVTIPPNGKPALAMIPVPVTSYAVPPLAFQKGGGLVINTATEGTGVLSVVYRNNSIYTVFPVAKNWGSGTVSALRFYKIDVSGKVQQEITYGSQGAYYYMPAVAVDPKGNVVLAFTRSSGSEFAGFFVAGKKLTQPPSPFSNRVTLQAGLANYKIGFPGSNIARWGDYNGITAAPDGTIWAFGQYSATATEWQTVVGQLSY